MTHTAVIARDIKVIASHRVDVVTAVYLMHYLKVNPAATIQQALFIVEQQLRDAVLNDPVDTQSNILINRVRTGTLPTNTIRR